MRQENVEKPLGERLEDAVDSIFHWIGFGVISQQAIVSTMYEISMLSIILLVSAPSDGVFERIWLRTLFVVFASLFYWVFRLRALAGVQLQAEANAKEQALRDLFNDNEHSDKLNRHIQYQIAKHREEG